MGWGGQSRPVWDQPWMCTSAAATPAGQGQRATQGPSTLKESYPHATMGRRLSVPYSCRASFWQMQSHQAISTRTTVLAAMLCTTGELSGVDFAGSIREERAFFLLPCCGAPHCALMGGRGGLSRMKVLSKSGLKCCLFPGDLSFVPKTFFYIWRTCHRAQLSVLANHTPGKGKI